MFGGMTTRFAEIAPSSHPYAKKTADEYESEARRNYQAKEDSFDRCDTDGFLSQWASDLTAQEASRKAQILRNGGMCRFVGLYQGDRRVKARVIETQFGHSWVLHDDEKELIQARGKVFLPTGKKSRIHKQLGVQERPEWDTGWAHLTGEGTGLSGRAWVGVFRCDKWGENAIPLTSEEVAQEASE